MNKYFIKIKKIEILNDYIIITSYENQIFTSHIIKGSIKFKIYNNIIIKKSTNLQYQEIGLNNLEENDNVIIYGDKNIDKYICIKKIKIKNKYIFNSDSSTEEII